MHVERVLVSNLHLISDNQMMYMYKPIWWHSRHLLWLHGNAIIYASYLKYY